MKDITTSVLGFDVPVSGVPETLQEAITAAGSEQAMLDGWNSYIRFHRTNGEARAAVIEALEAITGIERETEQVKSPTKADPNRMIDKYSESEQQYAERALAQNGKSHAELAPQVLAKVGTIEFKAVGEPRVGGPGKLAKVYTENAQTLINAGEAAYSKAVDMLEQKNPGLKIDLDDSGAPTVASLAAALKANKVRVEREANEALGLVA